VRGGRTGKGITATHTADCVYILHLRNAIIVGFDINHKVHASSTRIPLHNTYKHSHTHAHLHTHIYTHNTCLQVAIVEGACC